MGFFLPPVFPPVPASNLLPEPKPTMSELQLRDVRTLLATGADVEYLRRWAPELSVSGLLEEQLNERHQP